MSITANAAQDASNPKAVSETIGTASRNKKRIADQALTNKADRLLRHLSPDDAFAVISTLSGDGTLDVFHVRRGISLRVAGSTMAAAELLIKSDLCNWSSPATSGRKYLTLSPAGKAHLKRDAGADNVSPFVSQHSELEETSIEVAGLQTTVTCDNAESPLAWLARRKGPDGLPMINASQLEAGERFRRDLELAQLRPNVTANWSSPVATSVRGDTAQHMTDLGIAAKQRVNAAIETVGGDFASLLIDVCGFLKSLKTIEFERRWPQRSAKIVLGLALARLAEHYGLRQQATGPDQSGPLRHWGSSDYRPVISMDSER